LLKAGYSSAFATALIINASDIAFLIPPSIGMIFYGVITGTSVGGLFLSGVGPGLLVLVVFSIYCYVYSIMKRIPILPKASWSERWRSIKDGLPAFGFPVIVMGGIYTGIFTPTEAAAVSVLYAFILEVIILRSIDIRKMPMIAMSTGIITSVVFILLGVGTAFSWLISYAKLPAEIVPQLIGQAPTQIWLLTIISAVFFVGCMFMDPLVCIIILAPIFHPIGLKLGIDPLLMGLIVTLQVAIGSATPPFGCDIFTAIAIFRRPYFEVVRGTPPFIAMLLFCNFLIIFYPQIALFLPHTALG
jgi:tripartite ATP-independent transporter DctM subunit